MKLSGDSGSRRDCTFEVIVLGASGGPREDTVTGLLVRATDANWAKGSVVAVDGGTLLAGIIRILEKSQIQPVKESKPPRQVVSSGPFEGLELPNLSPEANAAYIFREIMSGVLITHPHLDHVAGIAMNTPAVEAQSAPKSIAALPSTISALKNHVFNDITWPNLSDEDGGAGLVTYQRLADGGNQRLGVGPAKGYVKACDGLMTKCMGVSHGKCRQRYNPDTEKHHRAESTAFLTDPVLLPSRRVSVDGASLRSYSPSSPAQLGSSNGKEAAFATVESSAFFLRNDSTGTEIMIFGDIEPDSISLEPRNEKVWEAAAPRIMDGSLKAIFIECSYTDEVDDNSLYGHLCPRHLAAELEVLASKVLDLQKPRRASFADSRKRKRTSSACTPVQTGVEPLSPKSTTDKPQSYSTSPKHEHEHREQQEQQHDPSHSGEKEKFPGELHGEEAANPDSNAASRQQSRHNSGIPLPLQGLQIHIIHVKDKLEDNDAIREQIICELNQHKEEAGLGCEFFAPLSGEHVYI